MHRVIDIKSKNPLLGTWKYCDGFSDIEFTVTAEGGNLTVVGIDTHDGEKAEIHDISWSPEQGALQFSAHWPSTGRFVKYRVCPASIAGRVNVTYTYSTQETWERVR
jgi:hypothetical protein